MDRDEYAAVFFCSCTLRVHFLDVNYMRQNDSFCKNMFKNIPVITVVM